MTFVHLERETAVKYLFLLTQAELHLRNFPFISENGAIQHEMLVRDVGDHAGQQEGSDCRTYPSITEK